MGAQEKQYSPVEDANKMIKELCIKYPDELWAVNPDIVTVLGVENKKRGKKNRILAKIIPVKGAEKAVFQLHHVPVRYIIEVYWNDWNDWKERLKQWIIFHELQHVSDTVGKTVRHDLEDFKMIIDAVGVNWSSRDDLPSLLGEEKVKFNLDLRPAVMEYKEENENKSDDDDDEIF